MQRIVEKYAKTSPDAVEYTRLLQETNIFGLGKILNYDKTSCHKIIQILSRMERHLDLEAAGQVLANRFVDKESMKISVELEHWAFFGKQDFSNVLFVGCGAYPVTAIHVLKHFPRLRIDGIDTLPQCAELVSQVAWKLGLSGRLRAFTQNATRLDQDAISRYDGFFIASAVRPKSEIITRILDLKSSRARVYAREDEAHPFFYERVEIYHPDLLTARQARAAWLRGKGSPLTLPAGCEVTVDESGRH